MDGVSGLEGTVGGSGTTERTRIDVRMVSGVAALRGGASGRGRSTALRGGVSGAGGRGPGRSTEGF